MVSLHTSHVQIVQKFVLVVVEGILVGIQIGRVWLHHGHLWMMMMLVVALMMTVLVDVVVLGRSKRRVAVSVRVLMLLV